MPSARLRATFASSAHPPLSFPPTPRPVLQMLGQLTQSLTDLAARQPLAAVLINQAAALSTRGRSPMH